MKAFWLVLLSLRLAASPLRFAVLRMQVSEGIEEET